MWKMFVAICLVLTFFFSPNFCHASAQPTENIYEFHDVDQGQVEADEEQTKRILDILKDAPPALVCVKDASSL